MESVAAIVVTCVGSAITSVIALIQTLRIQRISAQTSLKVERLKAEPERRRHAFETAVKEMQPLENALEQAWADIQKIKGEIDRRLAPGRYDPDLSTKVAGPACESLSAAYEKFGSLLQREARTAWHDAKGTANGFLLYLQTDSEPESDHEIKLELARLRHALSDSQTTLSMARQRAREDYFRRLLEMI